MATSLSAAPDRQRSVTAAFSALRLLDRPTSTSQEVAEALEQEPQLGKQMLKMARSPLFGVRSPDLTVARAVVLLGFVTVRKLVVLSLCRDLGSLSDEAETDQWRRALWVGIAAEQIMRRIDEPAAAEALMAGMVSVMSDAFDGELADEAVGRTRTVDPARMARFIDAAVRVADLVIAASPGLPPTTDVDEALEAAGLGPLSDGRLGVDIRRGFDLYASLLV